MEGVEERTLVVDIEKLVFKKEPFSKSIEAINADERVSLIGYINMGLSKGQLLAYLGSSMTSQRMNTGKGRQ